MSRDLPPLNALRAFEAAARLGSFSEAARELHVTHGAISRQLKQLEEALGLALFVKEGRGVKLTDAGQRLGEAASEAFERLRSACAELQRHTAEAPFVLGCPGSLLARWFIPRLDRLNRELPELRLQLSASEGELDPRKPGLDATLWYAEPPWPADMQVFELAAERIGPVLSPHHPRCAELRGAPAAALLGDELMTAAFLDDAGVLGAHVAAQPTSRYRTRHERVVAGIRDLQRQGRIVPDVEPEALALALSSATLGLLSAARTLGPLDRATLESAIDTVGRMAASFETE